MSALETVLEHLPGARRNGAGWAACCPAHNDHNPSLGITVGEDGRVLLCCRAGCPIDKVLAAIGIDASDLFDQPATNGNSPGVLAEYPYVDESGTMLFVVERRLGKSFRQRQPDGNGGWTWNVRGVRRLPYRLPEVVDAIRTQRRVFIAEGEKDVDALRRAGEVATCNSGGAGKWRDEHAEALRGVFEVIIVADRDDPGRAHAQSVAASLAGKVASVRIVEAAEGCKDAHDHLEAGHGVDDFVELAADEPAQPEPETQLQRYLTFVTDRELRERVAAMPAPQWLARPVVPADAHWILAGEDKSGKSWALADLAVSVAYGGAWLGAFPCDITGPVLGFLGEGGERKHQRRLDAIRAHKGIVDEGQITFSFRVPHLSDQEHLDQVSAQLDACPALLVIVDPLYLSARGANGADLYAMGGVLEGLQHITQDHGAGLAFATHFKKGEADNPFAKITGVGPGAWGRVLVTAEVVQRHTDPHDQSTQVTLDLNFRGDEIPDTTTRIRRTVSTDNPDDLTSAMHYTCDVIERTATVAAATGLRPSETRVLAALDPEDLRTVQHIGDRIANDGQGMPLKHRTIQTALKTLTDAGLADTRTDPTDPHGRRTVSWAL